MSALTASPVATRRPATVSAAIALLVLFGVGAFILLPTIGDFTRDVIVIGFIFGAMKLIAAAGMWRRRKWAAILGFVAVLLDSLLAAPGVFFAEDTTSWILATSGVVLGVITLILIAHPSSRRAYV